MTNSSTKAWIIPAGSTAGAEGLRLVERPVRAPGPGEVLVRMRAWPSTRARWAARGISPTPCMAARPATR